MEENIQIQRGTQPIQQPQTQQTATTFDLVITSNNSDNISGTLVWEAIGQE